MTLVVVVAVAWHCLLYTVLGSGFWVLGTGKVRRTDGKLEMKRNEMKGKAVHSSSSIKEKEGKRERGREEEKRRTAHNSLRSHSRSYSPFLSFSLSLFLCSVFSLSLFSSD